MTRPRTALCIIAALAASPAVARSLPKAEPAPQVSACPEMGEGFVRLSGSATCVNVGGLVRVEVLRQGSGGSAAPANR